MGEELSYYGIDVGGSQQCSAWQCHFYGHNDRVFSSLLCSCFPETNNPLGSVILARGRDF